MGKWSRRAFISTGVIAGGGLIVGVAIRPGHREPKLAPLVTSDNESLLTTWVKLSADNRVTAIVPHAEMGQGALTALAQMLADEMDAAWELTDYREAPAHQAFANYSLIKGFILGAKPLPEFLVPTVDGTFLQLGKMAGLQITGGSTSVRFTGLLGMRVAGAAARELLLKAAAEQWQVPITELSAENSFIEHTSSSRRAPFAEFAQLAATFKPSSTPVLKKIKQFKIMGQSVPRRDIPAKVDGTARFAMDVDVPGMRYATIQASPVFGGTVDKLDASAAEALSGVDRVVNLGNAVAVIASGYWIAKQALQKVQITWDSGPNADLSQDRIFAQFDENLNAGEQGHGWHKDVVKGDTGLAFNQSNRIITADYRVPYLAHACMEPLNATAWIHGDICEVWVGCQNPLGFRDAVAKAIDFDPDSVHLHNQLMGGGFGRKSIPDYAVQAARLAKESATPVQLIWSREEDIRQDHYRPAISSRFKAALDADGQPTAWQNNFVDKHEPHEAPHIPYAIPAQKIGYVDSPTHVPFGPWRSVDHSQHGFFTESFIDELAHAARQDPYEYRRNLLQHEPRHLKVLDTVAQRSGWSHVKRPGLGRGISLQESFGSIVAQVVEVQLNPGGKAGANDIGIQVTKVTCVVDPGFAVSPDGLIAQMESGIVYGLTAALYGEVSIDRGAVVQSNFHDYPMLRIAEAPSIDTHIIISDNHWGGAGEPGTPGIAPALTNAIFDATGNRIRELPVKNHDLRSRIDVPDEVA